MDEHPEHWTISVVGGENTDDHARYLAIMLDEFIRHQPMTRLGEWIYFRRVNRRFKRLTGREWKGF